jgi:hypothetical protein
VDFLVEAFRGGAEASEHLVEVVRATVGVLEAFVIHDEAFEEVFLEGCGGPAAELARPESLAEEAAIGIVMDGGESFFERRGCWLWRIGVPLTICPFPEDFPMLLALDIGDFGDGSFDEFLRVVEDGADEEEFDGLVLNSLAFADLIAQMEGRTTVGPEVVFEGF